MTDEQKKMYEVLNKSNEIALATCVENIPNVRVVNFCFDNFRMGILYFATDRNNKKVEEFAANNNVSFTTIPGNGESVPHVRSNNSIVRKSNFSIEQLKEFFIAKIPGYDEAIEAIGESLNVYEIEVKTATIVLGFDETMIVTF